MTTLVASDFFTVYKWELTGKADFENSLDNPDQVHDTTTMLTGAGRCFTFTAPGLSVNVLKLKKK